MSDNRPGLPHRPDDLSPDGGVRRVRGNDYRVLQPPEQFTPELRVSVVIPAYGAQDKLDLALQGLARQTYPSALTEIIVVDNGTSPPLRLPGGTAARLVVCDKPGRACARNTGLAEATGEVIFWLDSDVVLTPGAIEAHMRWHHTAPYLSVTSYIRFTEAPLPEELPDDLEAAFEPAAPHAWLVDLVERTEGLTTHSPRPFSLHVGGATSVNAGLVRVAGPMDDDLIVGQDTEMGFRLYQAGAVFIPEPRARAYHLGPTMRMRQQKSIDRVSHAFVADRIPAYQWLRTHPTRGWQVPYVTAVIDGTAGYEVVRAGVDALLASTVVDLTVVVVGPWDTLDPDRRAPLKDPDLDLVLVHGHYEHESRVRLATAEEVDPRVPFVLRLPAGWTPGEDSLAVLLDLARTEGLGLVEVVLDEPAGEVARLERVSSFARARLVARPGEPLDDAVAAVAGVQRVDGDQHAFTREPAQPVGRRSAYKARIQAKDEVARLAKESERLRAQVSKWRDEAARWRKSTVELRREVGTLRRELYTAQKAQREMRTTLAGTVRRAIGKRLRG
ncbi:glycosyltransferase [Nonomuraea sp. KC401]|uniref:glycosyltransferase family 2 protein n=1 Tax=unclassified Nonomuraea TaxID=2593643 RepID=UPI0010FE6B3B|nr:MULTISPECIES: glycosyltransferase family 2 protein [unclassified Nonomuraea]NBE92251.1 glycosyltransferase [Nonomuraea sp. K271]TLF68269.1 glycosyltransferase [Nonomuraea sp. KC401]